MKKVRLVPGMRHGGAKKKYAGEAVRKHVCRLKQASEEIRDLVTGMLDTSDKNKAHNDTLELLQAVSDSFFDGKEGRRRTVGNSVKRGIEMAMLMHAYKRCGVADIGAFYYLVGEYDIKLLAKLGTKILPKTIVEANNANISYATQINIKPFIKENKDDGCHELPINGAKELSIDASGATGNIVGGGSECGVGRDGIDCKKINTSV